jgi:NDP-sugar pyrophosphorylase family protein
MKAMIFAAGLGTRLYPLTRSVPKALVTVAGKTLLQRAIGKISQAGFTEIIINIHHFGDQIIEFLNLNQNFGLNIRISDEREQLLDTGGAILKAAPMLKGTEPFLVYNVDVLSNLDWSHLYDFHIRKGGIATVAVRNRSTSRYLLFDEEMRLSGWKNIATGEEKIARRSEECDPLAFSGIQIIDPALLDMITETGKFSLIPLYLRLAGDHLIYGFRDTSSLWMDLGKPDQLEEAEKLLMC